MTDPERPAGDRPAVILRATRVVRPVFALIALAFIVYAAWQLGRRWRGGPIDVDVTLALASAIPMFAAAVLLAWGWKLLIDRMTARHVAAGPAFALHVESQLARYVPGKVGVPLVRMAGGPAIGVPARTIASSVAIELISFLAVGGGFGVLILIVTHGFASGPLAWFGPWGKPMLVAIGVAIAALLLVDRDRLPRAALDAMRIEGTGPLVPPLLPIIHLVHWVAYAAHGYLVSRAVGASHDVALASTGLYVIAPIVGFLALAAPAGLGVREALISFGLAHAVGPEAALAAAGISRAAALVSDLGIWLALRPLRARTPAAAPAPPAPARPPAPPPAPPPTAPARDRRDRRT